MNDLPAQRRLIDALCDPRLGALGAHPVRLIETHISWVLLAGRQAYKIKKAVDLGFLDFTDLEQRRFYCEEELRLNQRLAPRLYLEVLPIGGSPEHPVLGEGRAIEYAVKMRRFPLGKQMDTLLAKGKVMPQHMDSLASTLATFHQSLPAMAETPWGTPAIIRAAAMQNFEQLEPLLPEAPDQAQLAAVRQLSEAEYAARETTFAARCAQGCVRECHGDMHLGNIVLLAERPTPFDGIEFSAELRWEDVMSEAAFPVMDLLRYGQTALAYRLLNAYLEAGGDYEGVATLRFYLAYRAMVRAKVTAIRHAQPGMTVHTRSQALQASRAYLALAQRCLADRHPALILTHGLPGSGKTTFAQAVLERMGAIRIRSDVERKRLFGLDAQANSHRGANIHSGSGSRTGPDIYSQDATRRTYARLEDAARIALVAGFPVIVDAAFLRYDERARFHALAQELHAPFAIATLRAPDAVLRARIAQRRAAGGDASEADEDVLTLLQASEEPLTPEEQAISAEFPSAGLAPPLEASPGWSRLAILLNPR